MEKGSRRKWLQEDDAVRQWYDALHLGSEHTADGYLDNLARGLESVGLSAREFAALSQEELDCIGQSVLSGIVARGLSLASVRAAKNAMVSWLDWNHRRFRRRLRVGRPPKRPKARNYRVHNPATLRRVLDASTPRTRVITSLMAFSGLRPEVMGSKHGDRGLRLGALVGTLFEDGHAVLPEAPVRIDVDQEHSKNGEAYHTYLGREGVEYLAAYLYQRRARGEVLGLESPVLVHEKNGEQGREFVTTSQLMSRVRKVMRQVGLAEPPYIWRSYFATHLMLAEKEGVVIRDYRQHWMGHVGDIEAVYSVRKTLGREALEDMRGAYAACCRFLEPRGQDRVMDARVEVVKALLEAVGCDVEGVDLEDPDALQRALQEQLQGVKEAPSVHQQIVDLEDVEDYLCLGWRWRFEAPVPEGKALIEAPEATAP